MSRKRQRNNQQNRNEGVLSNLSDTANSAVTTASSNKGILVAVGICAGVAGYLFGTEHGRKMQSQIGNTLKDSFESVRDGAMAGWDKLSTTVQDQIDRFGGQPVEK